MNFSTEKRGRMKRITWSCLGCLLLFSFNAQAADKVLTSEGSTLQSFRDCPDCPEMVVIQAGSFDMGSSGYSSAEKPVHRVTISSNFALGKTEITQGQWKLIMGSNPSKLTKCGNDCPVEKVSWNDAQVFIRKLNTKTGKQYRLPSEAEWEYACRAGERQEYCGSDDLDSVGWYLAFPYKKSGSTKAHRVATKQANAWGLYDMSGNVMEWVEDSFHGDYSGAPTDGSAWTGGSALRVLRGGSWGSESFTATAAFRGALLPEIQGESIGFRLARTLP